MNWTDSMNENDLKEIEQLNATIAEYLSEIQSLTDEVLELRKENRRIKLQARNVCCDED